MFFLHLYIMKWQGKTTNNSNASSIITLSLLHVQLLGIQTGKRQGAAVAMSDGVWWHGTILHGFEKVLKRKTVFPNGLSVESWHLTESNSATQKTHLYILAPMKSLMEAPAESHMKKMYTDLSKSTADPCIYIYSLICLSLSLSLSVSLSLSLSLSPSPSLYLSISSIQHFAMTGMTPHSCRRQASQGRPHDLLSQSPAARHTSS